MISRLGEIIKDTREYKEFTRAELAEFAGVTEETIAEIEEDIIIPGFDTAFLIIKFLDIKIDLGCLRLITDIGSEY